RLAEHLYGSKLGTHTEPPAIEIPSASPGTVVVVVSPAVRASSRETVPVVGATTQTALPSNASKAGSGKPAPRSAIVCTTVFVSGSIRDTVLSTSFVTQKEPAATRAPDECL